MHALMINHINHVRTIVDLYIHAICTYNFNYIYMQPYTCITTFRSVFVYNTPSCVMQ